MTTAPAPIEIANLTYGEITGRFGNVIIDSSDPGREPDIIPITDGEAIITTSAPVLLQRYTKRSPGDHSRS